METVTEAIYGPLSLDLGETYFWRIDEVNDPGNPETLDGDVWNFSTHEFLIVDDFEIYDANENQVWAIWHEGIGYWDQDGVFHPGNGTGSGVGDENNENSYMEETIVRPGSTQSMPYFFNNSGSTGKAYYSEAKLTLSSIRDWTQKDVKALTLWFQGYPPSVGSFIENPAGTYTMTATGADIYGTADEFHYAYQMLSGGGSIEAQVLSVEDTDDWAKAGVMIRDRLEPGSKWAGVYITPGNGCRFQARLETDADATSDTSVSTPEQRAITAPYWVRLERSIGGGFRGYYSSDGSNWVPMSWNPQNIQMNADVYIGLAVTSHNPEATCQAQFSNVTSDGTGPWLNQDIGLLSNDPERMYVAIANSNGTTGTVYYEDNDNVDIDATLIDTWTEWNIDLKDFQDQGVNLADVNSIAIGIGTRGGTIPGGEGKMYFDDIRLYPSRCILSRRLADFATLDYVEDCIVDYKELELMAGDWLASEPDLVTDLNEDSVVDFKDYAILADEWIEEQLWPQS
jgi:hypothetical protein